LKVAPGGTVELGGWLLRISDVRIDHRDLPWPGRQVGWPDPFSFEPLFDFIP
jgi:hypothetical protein